MTHDERTAILDSVFAYTQANLTFEVGPAVRCDAVGDGIHVVISDGVYRKVIDETFVDVETALARFAVQAAPVQLSLWEV